MMSRCWSSTPDSNQQVWGYHIHVPLWDTAKQLHTNWIQAPIRTTYVTRHNGEHGRHQTVTEEPLTCTNYLNDISTSRLMLCLWSILAQQSTHTFGSRPIWVHAKAYECYVKKKKKKIQLTNMGSASAHEISSFFIRNQKQGPHHSWEDVSLYEGVHDHYTLSHRRQHISIKCTTAMGNKVKQKAASPNGR